MFAGWIAVAALLVAGMDDQPAPGFVVNGKVTDGTGSVVAGVTVTAVYRDVRDGRPFTPVSIKAVAESQADGRFSLSLPYAGEFYIVGLPRPGRPSAYGHRTTFHPSARSVLEAKPVSVEPGLPAIADIVMLPAKMAIVSGIVLGSDGKPVPNARVAVARGEGFFGLASVAFGALPDGTFRVGGVPPGTYFFAYRESAWPPPRDIIPKVSQATVVVDESDVAGVRVMPLQMVRATGRVVVDPALRASVPHAATRVSAFPVPVDGNPGPGRGGQVQQDLTFEFRTWPMPGKVRVFIEAPGWTVKAVRLNGTDITDKAIDFVQGKEITGLEIELVRR